MRTEKAFGSGNVELGTIELLEKLKARDRASTIREFARTKGIDLSGQKVTMNVHEREGNPVQKQVTIAELWVLDVPLYISA
jgi:hypothetical protein